MFRNQEFWSWVVLLLSAGAYIPLAKGGYDRPSEINLASYSIWLMLSAMLLYSARKQGFAGWRLPLGFFIGNISMIALGFYLGGYTFNLGPVETLMLFGIAIILLVWIGVGSATNRWNPRIIYLGVIAIDILSFYPQVKQYLAPNHEPATLWTLAGWVMWMLGAWVNFFLVERFFVKLREKTKPVHLLLEESAFSIENGTFIIVTMYIMAK